MFYSEHIDNLALRLANNDLIEYSEWQALSELDKITFMEKAIKLLEILAFGGVSLPDELEMLFVPFNDRVRKEYIVRYNKEYYQKVNELYTSSLEREMADLYNTLINGSESEVDTLREHKQTLDRNELEGYTEITNEGTVSSDFGLDVDDTNDVLTDDDFSPDYYDKQAEKGVTTAQELDSLLSDTSEVETPKKATVMPTYGEDWGSAEELFGSTKERPVVHKGFTADFKSGSRRMKRVVNKGQSYGVVQQGVRAMQTSADRQTEMLDRFASKVLNLFSEV